MADFRYRAITADGTRVDGTMQAGDVADLEDRLHQSGLDLVRARPAGRSWRGARGKVSRRSRIQFCVLLEQLLAAGMPMLEALADLRDATGNPRLRDVITAVTESVRGGLGLSAALARHPEVFDAVFSSLVRAGEESGSLPQILQELARSLKREDELAAYSRRIVIYPAFVGLVLMAAVLVSLVYVVPEIAKLFQATGQALPLQTRILIGLSGLVRDYGGWLLGALAALVFAARLALARSSALRLLVDRWKLGLPLLGPIQRKIALARFVGLLATLYAAGITIVQALQSADDVVDNSAMRAAVQSVGRSIASGASLADSFAQARLFPPLICRMIRIGETTGGLDRALGNAGYFYERDVREAVEQLQAIVEPAMTLLLGGLLAWMMTAILAPIYDIITRIPT